MGGRPTVWTPAKLKVAVYALLRFGKVPTVKKDSNLTSFRGGPDTDVIRVKGPRRDYFRAHGSTSFTGAGRRDRK